MSYIIVSREYHLTRYYCGNHWSDIVSDAITFTKAKNAKFRMDEIKERFNVSYHVCELVEPDIEELINL